MHSSLYLTTVLLSTLTHAIPTPPSIPSLLPLLSSISTLHHLSIDASHSIDIGNTSPPPSSLQPVPSGMKLQYAAIGLGTQNYTCTSPSSTASAEGARATLYDATAVLRTVAGANKLSEELSQQVSCHADARNAVAGLPQLGQHYFTIDGVPSFDLSAVGKFLSAKKVGTADAPSTACSGRDGGAAVAWLFLEDDGKGCSKDLKAVYRVNTAGGSPDAENPCEGVEEGGVVTRDYSAQYMFYA
ncbi:MAG: hypothetical protein M1828_000813 [Chrysothrix sp. TS-e1954]|nr:MAG: hypothetical protein M1828_000813 [Chrysothrix sp. TS-e1954]